MRRIDLTGQHFGDLEVLEYAGDRKWKCKCSCGNLVIVYGSSLREGTAHSCGHDNPKKFKDLSGNHFGDWEVLEYAGSGYWKCKCSCGTIKNVAGWHLRSGRSTSCGHNNTGCTTLGFKEDKELKLPTEFDDLYIGKHIGDWELLAFLGGRYWLCRCSCGNTREVSSWALKSGNSKSCGECKFEDLTGKHFGEWEVLAYKGSSKWECKCSCGEIKTVNRNDLIHGRSKCCGGWQHTLKNNLIGKRFGNLEVTKYVGKGQYECKCDCGNTTTAGSFSLIDGLRRSCGCKQHESKYTKEDIEAAILKYRIEHDEKPTTLEMANILRLNAGYFNTLIKKI